MEQGAVEHGAGSGARSREPWSREPWSRGAWSRGAAEQGAREQEHAHEVCAAIFPGLIRILATGCTQRGVGEHSVEVDHAIPCILRRDDKIVIDQLLELQVRGESESAWRQHVRHQQMT